MPLTFALLFALIFFAVGLYLPFWPVWLSAKGLSADTIGLFLAVGAWLRILVVPLLGRFADRRGGVRPTIMALALTAAAAFALAPLADLPALLLTVQLTAVLPLLGLIPLADAAAMAAVGRGRLDYGRARLWGSIAFIAAAWGGGWAIGASGVSPLPWALAACALGIAGAAILLERPQPQPRTPGQREGLAVILRYPRLLAGMAGASLLQGSHALYYGFATLAWQAAGFSDQLIGLLWAIGVVAEVVLFALARYGLDRWPPHRLFALAAGAAVVRWSGMALVTAPLPLAGLQCLHAFTFGAAHLGALRFIAATAPPGAAATAQTVYSALSGGLAMGGLLYLAGGWYASFGAGAFFAMAAVAAVGFLTTIAPLPHGGDKVAP